MGDSVEKVLLVILGILLGISGQIIVNANNEKKKKVEILEMMRTEITAFIRACENAERSQTWDSSTVEMICKDIMHIYSSEKIRLITALKPVARQGAYNFFLEVTALLSLIESHRKQEVIDAYGATAAIGPGTYTGVADRSKAILADLKA